MGAHAVQVCRDFSLQEKRIPSTVAACVFPPSLFSGCLAPASILKIPLTALESLFLPC